MIDRQTVSTELPETDLVYQTVHYELQAVGGIGGYVKQGKFTKGPTYTFT